MIGQLVLNALIAGSIYTLAGLGFAVLYRITRFFDFSFGLIYPIGAYSAFVAVHWLRLPLSFSVLVAIVVAVAAAILLDTVVYAPLRRHGASTMVFFLASIGVYVLGQNLLSIVFGDAARSIRPFEVVQGMDVLGARITMPQVLIVASAIACAFGTAMMLSLSAVGRQIRAVADDRELAAILGVRISAVILITIAVGAALGGLAGVLSALDRDMIPTMGMNLLLMGIVAMIVGGRESVLGVAFGAYLVGLAQNLGILWIPSMWQDAIVFVILITFLLFRPQGLRGRALKRFAV